MRGKHLLSPEQWTDALHILERNGVVFHLILGNELFSYPDPVGFVRAIKPFWGRYGLYSTFPEGWTKRYFDDCINAGLYNISCGVDTWPGLKTGDKDIDVKSSRGLYCLEYALKRGVPDVQATVTIHRHNYDKLEPLLDLCTSKGIWIGASLVEASADGRHDFYGSVEQMKDWLIPKDKRAHFRDCMYNLSEQIQTGRWMMQVHPSYFEEMGDRVLNQNSWHCSLPLLISLEEDGALRACGYRGGLAQRHSVFDLREGAPLSMQDYVHLQREKTQQCPGCGEGAWSYWWLAEQHLKGDLEMGDRVFQTHLPGYEFEKTVKK